MTQHKSAEDKEANNDHLPRRREDIEILSIQCQCRNSLLLNRC